MFDNIYSSLIKRVPYKPLIVIPILLSFIMLFVIYINGIQLGIDFQGGTLIEVSPESEVNEGTISSLRGELVSIGLEDLKVSLGKDLETDKPKVSISTTSVDEKEVSDAKDALVKHFGELRESDIATAAVSKEPADDLKTRLASRLKQSVDVSFDRATKILTITAVDLNEADLESALTFYLEEDVDVTLEKKNLNIDQVQPALGEKLKTDGFTAAIVGYILMALVIFLAFRDFVPCMAVLLSATCDAVITLGLMSITGIVLEPASLVALLMLIGYSVDTDVLLTTRMLKKRKGDVNESVDSAIKTGLTMTGTTLSVMLVVVMVSAFITHVDTLTSIGSVLLLGLIADITSTWFMNAGILKWYIEERGGKFSLFGSIKKMLGGK